ncbi:MAG: hypothetical protein ACREVN_07585 [Gammaproteobacteria bacterium]
MLQSRFPNPSGLQFFSFVTAAAFYVALTVWIYLAFPALLGVFAIVATAIVLAGQLERLTAG